MLLRWQRISIVYQVRPVCHYRQIHQLINQYFHTFPVPHDVQEDHIHPRFLVNEFKQYVPKNILELEPKYWRDMGKDFVEKQVNKKVNTNRAKNVIMFLGDGMSIPTLAATRVYISGEETELSFEKFPYVGLSKTYCVDKQVADSACTATAYLSGVKANYATIGVNARVLENDCTQGLDTSTHTSSIAKWAQDAGKATGLVTTTRVTHASPAGVYAHTANRDWEDDNEITSSKCDPEIIDDIAEQLVYGDVGKNLKVILGGGRRQFMNRTSYDEEGTNGKRRDGKNLIGEWLSMGTRRQYVWNKTELMSANPANTDNLLGLFEASHNKYHLDVVAENSFDKEPTLKEMVQKAIEFLSRDANGYFLFVEGGRIDHAHHDTVVKKSLEETKQFSEAIEYAKGITNEEDTLIVVTSDHSHTMSYSGYAVSIACMMTL